MKRDEFRYVEKLRVRWAEIDAQHIVFNGHYLMYFDTAIAGYWRALRLPYHATMQALQGDLYVRKASLEYLGSARYDDALEVGVRCARIGSSSMQFSCAVLRQGKLLVPGELIYVFADPTTQTAKPVPEKLRAVLMDFEAGADMLRLEVGPWSELQSDALRVRTEVFLGEQHLSNHLEFDEADGTAVHVVAYNRLNVPLGSGRLYAVGEKLWRIGRVAVVAAMRNSGIGALMLGRLLELARGQGAERVVLSAQVSAQEFYARAGFSAQGNQFEEAGIAHLEMTKAL